ncbi:MAG: bifunctional UDP-N-acetylglucosamine diphosphorylase/glucosamine-1-phosphate N-acetyltransferase GlmU [Alphaproteobacteria bacterium]|nr:bifunctional UDP-N-acetylglucosamine diphosphorylase/glucosamine-1-phosphate N-acetyltransferase GlmU [Alphaproteobacteria bacterium]
MAKSPLAVVVLAAGLGTRMRSELPKVLHEVAGRPLIGHVMAAVAPLAPVKTIVVVGPRMEAVVEAARAAAPKLSITPVVQRDRRGTGHAVRQAERALRGFRGDILIVIGDAPLMRPETLKQLVSARRDGAAVAVLAMDLRDPADYGRMVTGPNDTLERIVEARDATDAERAITLCNAGVIAADGSVLFELLARLKPDNAKREYYLTDIVGLARAAGQRCTWTEAPVEELIAVNTRAELAAAEAAMQARLRASAMANGATLADPASVWFSYDTVLGQDVTVGPGVVFGPEVRVADGVEIRAFCHLEGVRIGPGAIVGPFARLRPGADIGAGARVGNFVEVKNARIGAGAKANHLAYVGDARVGAEANIGAGTITCNYDGFSKHETDIGPGAFIGSNTTLVAPVRVGARAVVAGGSTITEDVAADALVFGRARQAVKAGGAKALRARLKRARKNKKKGA